MTPSADTMTTEPAVGKRLPMRDALFLLAHDEHRSFRPLVHLPALAVGIAGAVLADLAFGGHARADHTRVSITDPRHASTPSDSITAHAISTLRGAGWTLPLPTALGLLTPRLYERTRAGLVAEGHLTETPGTWRRRTRYALTNARLTVAVRAAAREAADGRTTDPCAQALCTFIRALAITDCLHYDLPAADVNAALDATADRMRAAEHTAIAAVPYLAAAVRGAVGDLATAVRR